MIFRMSVFVTGICGAALFSGCAETNEVTLYMQNLEVNGPVTQPPIHITQELEESGIHIIPRASFSTQRRVEGRIDGHTHVNTSGEFYVDTIYGQNNSVYFQDPGNVNTRTFLGKNLQWEIPSASFGLDVDVGLSQKIALSFGGTYTSVGNSGVWSYRAGLGFRGMNLRRDVGWRFDVGWIWQEHIYEASTVVTERPLSSSVSTVSFFEDRMKRTNGNFYGSFVVNSNKPEWPLNMFLQAGITKQSVTDVKPVAPRSEPWIIPPFFLIHPDQNVVRDRRGEFSATLVHLTPGAYVSLGESVCMVFGIRFSFETSLEDSSPHTIIIPVAQLDWAL